MGSHDSVRAAMEDLREQYEGHVRRLVSDLVDVMLELAAAGDARMVEILEAATTGTGWVRAARGGHPGRVESGTMRDTIGHSESAEIDGEVITVYWGWLEEVQRYFLLQEHGDEVFGVRFEGMHALRGSFIEMREELRSRIGGLT